MANSSQKYNEVLFIHCFFYFNDNNMRIIASISLSATLYHSSQLRHSLAQAETERLKMSGELQTLQAKYKELQARPPATQLLAEPIAQKQTVNEQQVAYCRDVQ